MNFGVRKRDAVTGRLGGTFLLVFAAISGVRGDIDVLVKIPKAVAENSTVNMTCEYDLRSHPLYSVKWYRGQQEFYRYLPKEMPAKYVFPPLSNNVDLNQSDSNSVILNNVTADLAGKYRCEVSADAPIFFTRMESTYMHVVRLPEGNLTVRVEKPRYAVGDTVRGNCTAPPGNPPANVTWTVNGLPVNASFLRNVSSGKMNDNRTMTVAGLDLEVNPGSFTGSRLHITCRATVFQLYREQVDIVLEEERPRLASVLGTRESSSTRNSARNHEEWIFLGVVGCALLRNLR